MHQSFSTPLFPYNHYGSGSRKRSSLENSSKSPKRRKKLSDQDSELTGSMIKVVESDTRPDSPKPKSILKGRNTSSEDEQHNNSVTFADSDFVKPIKNINIEVDDEILELMALDDGEELSDEEEEEEQIEQITNIDDSTKKPRIKLRDQAEMEAEEAMCLDLENDDFMPSDDEMDIPKNPALSEKKSSSSKISQPGQNIRPSQTIGPNKYAAKYETISSINKIDEINEDPDEMSTCFQSSYASTSNKASGVSKSRPKKEAKSRHKKNTKIKPCQLEIEYKNRIDATLSDNEEEPEDQDDDLGLDISNSSSSSIDLDDDNSDAEDLCDTIDRMFG